MGRSERGRGQEKGWVRKRGSNGDGNGNGSGNGNGDRSGDENGNENGNEMERGRGREERARESRIS